MLRATSGSNFLQHMSNKCCKDVTVEYERIEALNAALQE